MMMSLQLGGDGERKAKSNKHKKTDLNEVPSNLYHARTHTFVMSPNQAVTHQYLDSSISSSSFNNKERAAKLATSAQE